MYVYSVCVYAPPAHFGVGRTNSQRFAPAVWIGIFFNAYQWQRWCLLMQHGCFPCGSSLLDVFGDAQAPHLGLGEFCHGWKVGGWWWLIAPGLLGAVRLGLTPVAGWRW